MADYYAQTRSNYFKVKDAVAFRTWATSRELEVWEGDGENAGRLAITSENSDAEGWRRHVLDEEAEDFIEVDFERELAGHLQNGSVAVLMEIGNEKLRYLNGSAVAVNSRGETVTVDLGDIYQAAERLGGEVTRAEY